MKIAYLGIGAWGFCLSSLLALKKYKVVCWSNNQSLVDSLNKGEAHPNLRDHHKLPLMHFTTNLEEALINADMIVESVTTAGFREVFESVKKIKKPSCPIVITSKGIEKHSSLILPEVAVKIFGESIREKIALISGPSYAEEVIKGMPTSVVATSFDYHTMMKVCESFTTDSFRVYPNTDIIGVAYGGALKNVIAIACGISDGLGLGQSSKAALMTRGLHEIKKLTLANGGKTETLSGLSGIGDLCLTCGSLTSRNNRFGYLLAQGASYEEAKKKIEMVVEGVYTTFSAMEIGKRLSIQMPITEMVFKIIYEGMRPLDAVKLLMQRTIKEEHL